MRRFLITRAHSFRNALRGLRYVVRTQQNAWIHAIVTVLVVAVSFWLNLALRDWVVLFLAIALVWAAEFFNTSIEAVVDLASPAQHPLAKVGKDVGAAAVFIAALTSALIGFLILGPPLWERVKNLFL